MPITYSAPYPRIIRELTIDPGSIAAGAVLAINASVPGARTDAIAIVNAQSLETNLVLSTIGVTSANTVTFRIHNPTGAAIDPASQLFKIVVF